jgi:hypothetical protein
MPSLNNLIPRFTLFLLLATTSALPQDLPTRTLSSPLQARTGPNETGTIHLSPGAVAGLVIGVLAIVAISIVLCCPCWKWISCSKARTKSLHTPRELGDESGMQELDVEPAVRRGELSEQDAPPGYEEFGSNTAAAAATELDSKEADVVVRPENVVVRKQELDSRDTMVRPRNEMPASGMEHEMDGGGRGTGEWVVSPLSAVEGGRRGVFDRRGVFEQRGGFE